MKRLVFAGLGMLVTLTGCAVPGMVAAPPAHMYSRSEMLQVGPHQDLQATGVQEYCAYTYDDGHKMYAAQMKSSALANIAKACGGEDNYYVLKDMQANNGVTVYGMFGTMGTHCSHSDSRAIYFKCKGTTPQPSATTK